MPTYKKLIDRKHIDRKHIDKTHIDKKLKLVNVSKTIDISLGCSIIPILLSHLKTESLFNYISRYIAIKNSYKTLIEQIENNMKHNNLNMASISIELDNTHSKISIKTSSKTTKNTQTSKMHSGATIHQIYLLAINNFSYDTKSTDELLEIARISGNAMFNTLKTNQIKTINIVDTIDGKSSRSSNSSNSSIDSINNQLSSANNAVSGNTKFIEAILEGLLLSSYRFLKYKTDKALTKEKDRYKLSRINIIIPQYWKQVHSKQIYYRFNKLQNQIKTVFLARDLINEPANLAKSTTFINIIKSFIKENNLPITIEVLEKPDLEKMGMGLILGVGSGSSIENAPKVIIMKYKGGGSGSGGSGRSSGGSGGSKPEYILMGKGITFDTGGLDIKGTRSMLEMKTDLSGAATVCSFLVGYAMNKGAKCIYAICPFAENSVGPNATKPSDVLRAYNGRTVEITNTDAEGRLVLADCLAYAVDKYPNAIIIDFATLTGQQESLSCKMFSNILSVNSSGEVAKLIKSGKEINEQLVELPMMEKHLKHLESYVADIKNVSFSCNADIIMSSLFMRQFIKKDTKWVHIDIAGPSYKANEVIKYASPEASGVGVRLLFEYFDS